MWKKGEDWVL